MKREIKFKLWNPEKKVLTGGNYLNTILATTDNDFVNDFDKKGMVWLQFTGLPFDICEGDIISPGGNTNHPLRYVVLWNTYNCCFSAFLLHEYRMIVSGDLFDKTNAELSEGNIKRDWILEYEVKPIGNMYENPEMLAL